MIKIILKKDDKFLKLSSLVNNKKNFSTINIVLSSGCNLNIIEDLFVKGFNECKLIFDLEDNANLKFSLFISSTKKDVYYPVLSRDITVNLLGNRANSNFNIGIKSFKNQQINLITRQIHLSSDTSSLFNIKNVAVKNSKFRCDNLIRIGKDLSEIFAVESAKVLSLASGAEVVFKPKIEVDSQDVICKHEAAIFDLNEEQLFYLQSRGMNLKQAKSFLVKAFLN